jgi:hypothetical protein
MDELTLLRETLDDIAGRVPARAPTRAQIDVGLRRVRRRRRVVRVGRTVGALAAVGAVAASVQLGAVALPAWAPAVPVGTTAASALSAGPTRGSLAGDAAWLAALRDKVATFDRSESGGERWRAPGADRVDVLFAGDVGDYRLALVETPLRWGVIESRQQLWYLGRRGAEAAALEEGQNDEPLDVAAIILVPGNLFAQEPDADSVAVVLGSGIDRVEKVGPASVSATGSVAWPAQALAASEPGLWQLVVPAGAGRVFVRWPGAEAPMAVGDVGWGAQSIAARAALLPGMTPALRDGSSAAGSDPAAESEAPDDARIALAASVARFSSALGDGAGERRLLWSGTLGGARVDVVQVTAPSGGSVVVAVAGIGPDEGEPVALEVVPAGAEPAVGWLFREPAPGSDAAGSGRWLIGLVGPQGAVSAQVVRSDGTTAVVPLADGIGVAVASAAARVRFLGADGAQLADAPVTQPGDAAALYPPGV